MKAGGCCESSVSPICCSQPRSTACLQGTHLGNERVGLHEQGQGLANASSWIGGRAREKGEEGKPARERSKAQMGQLLPRASQKRGWTNLLR